MALLLSAFLGAIALPCLQAQVIVENLGADTGLGGFTGSDNWFGQAFVTPSGTGYSLTGVTLPLAVDQDHTGTFTVSLWGANQNGLPGGQIATISSGNSVDDLSTQFADRTFNLQAPESLTPSTTYFVVLSTSASVVDAGLVWGDVAPGNTVQPTGPGQIGGWTRSNDQGANWDDVDPTLPFKMAALGTPVPEPAEYAIFVALGLMAFAAVRQLRHAMG